MLTVLFSILLFITIIYIFIIYINLPPCCDDKRLKKAEEDAEEKSLLEELNLKCKDLVNANIDTIEKFISIMDDVSNRMKNKKHQIKINSISKSNSPGCLNVSKSVEMINTEEFLECIYEEYKTKESLADDLQTLKEFPSYNLCENILKREDMNKYSGYCSDSYEFKDFEVFNKFLNERVSAK